MQSSSCPLDGRGPAGRPDSQIGCGTDRHPGPRPGCRRGLPDCRPCSAACRAGRCLCLAASSACSGLGSASTLLDHPCSCCPLSLLLGGLDGIFYLRVVSKREVRELLNAQLSYEHKEKGEALPPLPT